MLAMRCLKTTTPGTKRAAIAGSTGRPARGVLHVVLASGDASVQVGTRTSSIASPTRCNPTDSMGCASRLGRIEVFDYNVCTSHEPVVVVVDEDALLRHPPFADQFAGRATTSVQSQRRHSAVLSAATPSCCHPRDLLVVSNSLPPACVVAPPCFPLAVDNVGALDPVRVDGIHANGALELDVGVRTVTRELATWRMPPRSPIGRRAGLRSLGSSRRCR